VHLVGFYYKNTSNLLYETRVIGIFKNSFQRTK